MLEEIIENKIDQKRVLNFIETEALSYRRYCNNGDELELNEKGREWVDAVIKKIVTEIKERKIECDFIEFLSQTNLGQTNAILSVTPKEEFWNFTKPDIRVTFCPCGNINHWGWISE